MTTSRPFELTRLEWEDEALGEIALPKAALKISRSFGSGLFRRPSDPPGLIWATGDRGPNLKVQTMIERYGADHLGAHGALAGAKVMPRPDVGPRIARLKLNGDRVELLDSFDVTDARGRPVSGLPMPESAHAKAEPALSLAGERLAPDPSGLDPEGIVALDDGSLILSEEFGPSLVRIDAGGRVLARYLPKGGAPADAAYPAYAILPEIAARRQLNRGFEAIAVSPDQKSLFVAFQSPLAHPDEEAHRRARHVRLWRLDPASMKAEAQYLYPLDRPETFLRDAAEGKVRARDLKVSEIVCLAGGALLVLERASRTTKLYRVTLGEPLPPEHFEASTRPTLEEISGAGAPLPCLDKQLLFNSDHAPEVSADLEGMAVLSPNELLLVNDSDFGTEGATTSFWRLRFASPVLA